MIAKTSSGRNFVALEQYLIHGRNHDQENRAEWTISRNLATDDPELAAPLMRATAAQNPRVEYPVYHLTIAFDPTDRVSRESMERVADRVLNELKLSEHQALLVAHNDREHAHLHIMVNRVHPDTLRAWERWQDRPIIERVLREEEQSLGLRAVPGKLYERDKHEHAHSERTASPEFVRVKEHAAEYRAARTWDALEDRLHGYGLRLERKGQGLVVTDGEHEVKASLVARDLSLRRLEERFGISYEEHRRDRPSRGTEPMERDVIESALRRNERVSRAVAEVAANIRERERLEALQNERHHLSMETSSMKARLDHLVSEAERVQSASASLSKDFERVYRDSGAAYSQFSRAAELDSATAVAALRSSPESFGELLSAERKRAFGLVLETHDAPAREAAVIVAKHAQSFVDQHAHLGELAKAHVKDAEDRLARAFGLVYRQPEHARAAFELALRAAGREPVLEVLKEHPERLGALAKTEETIVGRESPTARIAAWHLSERAAELIDAREAASHVIITSQTSRNIERAQQRERDVDRALESTPGRKILELGIARGLQKLEPAELSQLRRMLTNPQKAIAFKIGERIRDVALGREDELER